MVRVQGILPNMDICPNLTRKSHKKCYVQISSFFLHFPLSSPRFFAVSIFRFGAPCATNNIIPIFCLQFFSYFLLILYLFGSIFQTTLCIWMWALNPAHSPINKVATTATIHIFSKRFPQG